MLKISTYNRCASPIYTFAIWHLTFAIWHLIFDIWHSDILTIWHFESLTVIFFWHFDIFTIEIWHWTFDMTWHDYNWWIPGLSAIWKHLVIRDTKDARVSNYLATLAGISGLFHLGCFPFFQVHTRLKDYLVLSITFKNSHFLVAQKIYWGKSRKHFWGFPKLSSLEEVFLDTLILIWYLLSHVMGRMYHLHLESTSVFPDPPSAFIW